jgi:drug/metabolite transporter (DMT)-like permease
LDEIAPWTLRVWGFSLAAPLLFALVLARGGSVRVPTKHWWRLAILGLLATTGYNLLSAFAQLSATTSRSAVLSYTMPIWAVIFARLVLGEKLDGRRMAGLGLGVAGLLSLGWPLLLSHQLSWGLAFAVGSGVIWAAGNTFLKRFPIDASPMVISAWQLAFGAVTCFFGMMAFEGFHLPFPLSARASAAFAYHVVFAQALATALWFTILSGLPAGIAAIGSLLVPGVGVIGAALLLGERPSPADWLGLVLIVAASATVLIRPERERAPA